MSKFFHFLVFASFTLIFAYSSAVYAAPILRLHSQGHDVLLLQHMLQKENYNINATGIYDENTQRTVKTFQTANHLDSTGVVDRQTWQTLIGRGSAFIPPTPSNPVKPINKPPQIINPVILPARPEISTNNQTNSIKKPTQQSEEAAIALLRSQRAPETPTFLPAYKTDSIISTAKKYMGTPYIYGGANPSGFDCSGYLQYVFKQNNIDIPRTADEQYKIGKSVPVQQLQPGDLVFFATDLTEISHCGIYLGNGQFIHSSSSRGVRIDALDNDYWQKYFISGKHIVK